MQSASVARGGREIQENFCFSVGGKTALCKIRFSHAGRSLALMLISNLWHLMPGTHR